MGRSIIIYRHRRGFTLIELLVVISIIGLLATMATVALRNARIKGRDAARLGDMKQLHTAMELCADGNSGSYTTPTACCTVGANRDVFQCTGALLTTYSPDIVNMKDPSNVAVATVCNYANSAPCEYNFPAAPLTNAYTVYFYLEGNGGQNKMLTQTGIQ